MIAQPGAATQAGDSSGTASPPSLDDIINQAINAIDGTCSPGALDERVRNLCMALAAAKASSIVTNGVLDRLNRHLVSVKLPRIEKKNWSKGMQEATATLAVEKPQNTASTADEVLTRVRENLSDAPVPDDVVVPPGFKVLEAGVFFTGGDKDVEVMPTPLVIAARLVNSADGTESIRLQWYRDGRWKEIVRDRADIASHNRITELAGYGLPVTSLNAKAVVGYLAAFEAHNLDLLPQIEVRKQLGWVDAALSGFLWGRTYIRNMSAKDPDKPAAVDPFGAPAIQRPQTVDKEVVFRGADEGDDQAAAGYHANGTMEGWKAAVQEALKHPKIRLMLIASLAAPLIAILDPEGARNFVVDLCGESSKGKTTALRLAGSAWGLADENGNPSVMTTWNTTRVGAERRAGLVNGLPTIRDDTKLARKPEDVARCIYEIVEGRTGDRGTKKGLDRTSAFTTISLMSGESRAVSMSGDGGTRPRVLTLWGMPFERADQATALLVRRLTADLKKHYGHAGPEFVRFLLANRLHWPSWGADYVRFKEGYLAKASDNSVVGRLADAFAVLRLASELSAEALGMPCLKEDVIDKLWAVLTTEAAEGDRATNGLLHVYDWACANQELFYGRRSTREHKDAPAQGWAGRWDGMVPGLTHWDYIGLIPARLSAVLKEGAYDTDAVVSTWRDRGWLLVDKSDRSGRHRQVTIAGSRARVIAIKRGAFCTAGCDVAVQSEVQQLVDATTAFQQALYLAVGRHTNPAALAQVLQAMQEWQVTLGAAAQGPGPAEEPVAVHAEQVAG
jgi:putative DNA primase/helicase